MRSLWIFFYTKGAQNVMILSRNDFSSNSFHTISVENKSSITSIKERAFDFYSLDNSSRNSKSNTTLLFQDIRAFFLQSNNKSDVAVPGQKIEHSVVTPLLRKRRKYRRDGRKKVSSALSILEQTDSNVERVVGFFNMFERDGVVFSRIVNEQVGSIDASGLLNKIAYISYVYFGQNYLTFRVPSHSKKYVKSSASNAAGNEIDTLQLLHEHCVQHQKDQVFYLHTKGSYHPRDSNERLRRNLMKALLFCINQSEALGDGDVCGLRVSPVPYPQISGVQHSDISRSSQLSAPRRRPQATCGSPAAPTWPASPRRGASWR